jgi:LPXTG-motif cell wall-anchored protein
VIGGTSYRFVRWSDGGAREHAADCTAPARITATFQEVPFLEQHATALGGIGAVAAILAVLLAFLWRRRKKRQAAA